MLAPADIPLVGLSWLELQAPHGSKFESCRVRTFHSLMSATGQALNVNLTRKEKKKKKRRVQYYVCCMK